MRRLLLVAASLVLSLGAAPPTTMVSTPALDGSGMYALASGADGRVYLSWIDTAADKSHTLRFSRLDAGRWSAPRTIASGSNWFANWADHPTITAQADGTLLAHWLVNNVGAKSGYGYGLRIARSTDGGTTWIETFKAGVEHLTDYSGFVTMVPDPSGFTAIYLTPATAAVPAAPATATAAGAADHHEVEHVKTLNVARFDARGTLLSDAVVDADTCSCCTTSIVQTADGPIAAYRDHQGAVRDISVVRFRNGRWTAPSAVHADGWEINGCPTNGPVLASSGRRVAVAWFTAAGDVGRVRIAFSDRAGDGFAAPVSVDGGKPIGWPGIVMLEDGSAVVSWLEATTAGNGELRLRRVWPDGRLGEATVVAPAKAGRATGIPQLVRDGQQLVLAWRADRVMTAIVPIPTR